MKTVKLTLVFIAIAFGSAAHADEIFVGKGWCMIETLPCLDGQGISCRAEGYNGGYCSAYKKGKTYTVTCQAFGGGTYTRSCIYKRGLFGF